MAKKRQPISSRYGFFRLAVLFLALAQLLVGLDYVTIWPGGEAQLIWDAKTGEEASNFVQALLGLIPLESAYWLLWFRLPGVLLYLGTMYLFYRWGRILFGQQTVELALIIVSASLFVPIMPKLASLDVWCFSFSLVFWLSYVRLLKAADMRWLAISTVSGVLAIAAGQGALLFIIWMLGFAWWYRGSWNSNWRLAIPFIAVLVASSLKGYCWPDSALPQSYFSFNPSGLKQLPALAFIGIAPFIGFAIAGLRDLVYKLRKGEEWSKLLFIGLIGSLLSPSLIFPFFLIVLAARQLDHFFRIENYPWQNWVKGATVIHLILVFFVVVGALMGGAIQFKGDGFRAVLGCGAGYWMFSFVGVIGLYGFRRDYVLGGMSLAGLVGLLFFWVQLYPFIHLQRNWPERMTEKIEKLDEQIDGVDVFASIWTPETLPVAPYLLRAEFSVNNADKLPQLMSPMIGNQEQYDFMLTNDKDLKTDSTGVILKERGWSGLWQEDEWWLIDRR